MGLTRETASTRAELSAATAAAAASGARVLLLFCGAVDPATGHSWCSDCVAAEPVLEAALAAAAAAAGARPLHVVEVPLVRADFKGVASHWARGAPYGVSRVPALCRWGAARVTAALFEDECKDAAGVASFLDECA